MQKTVQVLQSVLVIALLLGLSLLFALFTVPTKGHASDGEIQIIDLPADGKIDS